MASLLGWLAYDGARTSAGAAVASGKAWFYQPGSTSTQVTVFSDADGLYALTQPVALDAGGRAVVYTDRIVQCEVQTAAGATVRLSDRANAVQASQVEIQNTIATGTSLINGSQVAGGRTDLNTFLSNLQASFGAADGLVKVGSQTRTLQDAIRAVEFFVDVKVYGAVGDGVTDDTAAIQEAFAAAADLVSGVVIFPAGTYKISSAITVSSDVSVVGVAPYTTVVLQTENDNIFESSGEQINITGVQLEFDTGNSGNWVTHTGFGLNQFTNCRFISDSDSGGFSATGALQFYNCVVGSPAAISAASIAMVGGAFTWADSATFIVGVSASFVNVLLTLTATSGTHYIFNGAAASALDYSLSNCRIQAANGSTLRLMSASGGGVPRLSESGCVTGGAGFAGTVIAGAAHALASDIRDRAYNAVTTTATSYAPDSAYAKYHEVNTSGASFQWSTPTPAPPGGCVPELVLAYFNNTGGAITPTLASGLKGTAASVGAGQMGVMRFVWDTSSLWIQTSAIVVYTP